MADNIVVTAGTGTTMAADEVVDATLGTVKVGYGKIMDGTPDSTNKLIVSAAGAAKVDGSAVTQPVSAASLPLPTGASTGAAQTTTNNSLSNIDGKLVTAKTSDYDTGVGTDTVQMQGIALPGAGGAVQGGTGTNPVRTDPTGSTTQPISAASLPLPTSAATETTLGTRLAEATFTTRIPVQGQSTMAASVPVTIASNQSAVPISGSVTANAGTNLNTSALALDATLTGGTAKAVNRGGAKGTTVAADITSNPVDANTQALHVDGSKVTQPISAVSLPLPALAATSTIQTDRTQKSQLTDGTRDGTIKAASTLPLATDTAVVVTQRDALPAGTAIIGALSANQSVNNAQVGGVAVSTGSGINGTGVQRVNLATDQAALTTAGLISVKIDQTTPGTTNAMTDTKLPASAASADALANPTITQIGADNMIFNGTTWDRVRGTGGAMNVSQPPSTLVVTATAAISTGVTLTLPAAGVGLFHYITAIEIFKYAGVAVVGAAAPVVVTTTNLPGSMAWSTPTAQAIGTSYDVPFDMITPLKSSVANTATTIVCPLTTSVIWRVIVIYYTAA